MEVKRKIFLVAISVFVATVFAVVDFYATDKRVAMEADIAELVSYFVESQRALALVAEPILTTIAGEENLANFDIAISATIQDFLDSLDHKE
jgi:hypothetical protein